MQDVLTQPSQTAGQLILKARRGLGLTAEETGSLIDGASGREWDLIFSVAQELTLRRFQNRLHFYVPLYFSNSCINDCLYCGFRRTRPAARRRLSAEEFIEEAALLWLAGHRSLLLVAGEHPVLAGAERLCALISELIRENLPFAVSVEVGPLCEKDYRKLADIGVRRCLLYQETYDREIYAAVHKGEKGDFDRRYGAMAAALRAGIPEAGLGILLGLADWKKDLPELVRHARYLEKECGRLPATLSFPRIRQAKGMSETLREKTFPVSDAEFEKIIALSRLALPSVGITLTTRESCEFRDRLLGLALGVTHVSAGSSTHPGGYRSPAPAGEGQFVTSDRRTLDELLARTKALGYRPVPAPAGQGLPAGNDWWFSKKTPAR